MITGCPAGACPRAGWCAARGITICLIEHNLDIVHGISDRIAFLDQGTVLAAGEPRAILNDPKLAAIYFGERR